MVDTPNLSGFVKAAADDRDGSCDDEPGPSPVYLRIDYAPWRTLAGARQAVLRAYDACVDEITAISGREVSILLSSDAAIAGLNARYRGKAEATNVLSFPAAGPAIGDHPPLGDIIIAYETLMRDVAAEHKPALSHLAHLTVHGILHLAGFDHGTDRDAERMENLEREILASIGISDPYSSTPEEQPASVG
jgi:probable rRNA maturation factor